MPNPIGSMGPRAIFAKKVRGMKQVFPRHQRTLQSCLVDVFKIEETGEGAIAEKTCLKLENMARISTENLQYIQAAMQEEPNLQFPREILSRFVYVIVNAQLLLARIERLESFEEDTDQVRVGSREMEEFDAIPSSWDPGPRGKKF